MCLLFVVGRRGSLVLLSLLSVDLSVVGDSITLGEVSVAVGAVGEMSSCCSTGCLSCRGKQSTSLSSLLLSSSVRSLLIVLDVFWQFSVAGVSVGDSTRLLQLGTVVGRDAMAVGRCGIPWRFRWNGRQKYHGDWCRINRSSRRLSASEYVGMAKAIACECTFEILNPGVVIFNIIIFLLDDFQPKNSKAI